MGIQRYDMTSLQTYCRYGGILLLEEKTVSNSPIDWQDIWVKDFKCTLNNMQY